jgi:hypothetical protein
MYKRQGYLAQQFFGINPIDSKFWQGYLVRMFAKYKIAEKARVPCPDVWVQEKLRMYKRQEYLAQQFCGINPIDSKSWQGYLVRMFAKYKIAEKARVPCSTILQF